LSGGKLDYVFQKVEDAAYEIRKRSERPLHKQFAEFLDKVAIALRDVEWLYSGDSTAGSEDEAILAVMSAKPVGEELNTHEVERLGRLAKRRDWLRQRIEDAEKSGKVLNFDKAEASALTWAIEQIEGIPALRKESSEMRDNLAKLGKMADPEYCKAYIEAKDELINDLADDKNTNVVENASGIWCGECHRGDHRAHTTAGKCLSIIPAGLSGYMQVVTQCACPIVPGSKNND
jgi:hypothetical protein